MDDAFRTSLKNPFLGSWRSSSISFSLAFGFVTMVSWYQKTWFSIGSQISYGEVSDSILMCHNSDQWFPIGLTIFGSVFFVTSSILFYSPLWKVVASSMLIFGSSSCFKLLMCPTLTLSWKTCSIFFIFFVNTIGIL